LLRCTEASGQPEVAASGRPEPSAKSERQAAHEVLRKAWKLIRVARNPAHRRALTKGVAAAVEHCDVAFGHDFATVIDVGAHHGQFALFALDRFPRAGIWCLEPLPPARRRFLRVLDDDSRVRLIPCAAGSHQGRLELHVAEASDLSSLLPLADAGDRVVSGLHEIGRVEVDTVRLDTAIAPNALKRPSLLKIDVQGYELEVLRGAEGLLGRLDELLIECSFFGLYRSQPLVADVVCHLRDRGFVLTGVFGLVRDRWRRCVEADLLFSRRIDE
jgi:FkbM family methyltransferase